MGLIGRPRKIAINWNYSGDKARSVLCQSRLGFCSLSAVPNQTKLIQEDVLVLKKEIVLEIIYQCQEKKKHFFRDQHKSTEAINAALRKIKYRGEQKLTQYLLTEEDMTRISTVNRFLTKLDIFSTTLGGDQYVTSSVLLPVIAAQAPRQSVCSAGWVSC